jgi:hypothetical protein
MINFGDPVAPSKSQIKQRLIEKWTPSKLLKNLNSYNQTVMAQLLENTEKEIKVMLKENMTTGDIASFYKLAFPLLRRTFAQLTITELVSTQAVDLPTTQIFYLDMVYDGASRYNLYNGGYASSMTWSPATTAATYPYGLSSSTQHILGNTINFDPTYSGPDNTEAYESSTAIPKIKFKISKTQVDVHTRKLQTEWTQEIEQDVSAYHGIDAEKTLTQFLGEYIALEINNEVLADLRKTTLKNAINYSAWNEDMNSLAESNASTYGYMTFYGTQLDWNKMLVYEINKVSNRIKSSTHRSGANWIVVSPDVSSILETVSGFDSDNVTDGLELTVGVSKGGTLSKRFKVYVDTMVDSMWRAVPALKKYDTVVANTGAITFNLINATADETLYTTPAAQWATFATSATTIATTGAEAALIAAMDVYFPGHGFSTTAGIYAASATVPPDPFIAYNYDWWGRNDVLLGYKGENFLDAGYVFCPYTMGILTPVIYEPYNYNYRRGIMSRYGKKLVRDGYYGRVEVALKYDDLSRMKYINNSVAGVMKKFHPDNEWSVTNSTQPPNTPAY